FGVDNLVLFQAKLTTLKDYLKNLLWIKNHMDSSPFFFKFYRLIFYKKLGKLRMDKRSLKLVSQAYLN
ncbi:hypothetical protein, partial [Nostoc sp.]|uniref:hypothetical protein n=1 Tax=Nostoc sp. TaxID=1180 RepID=UPI002FFC3B78